MIKTKLILTLLVAPLFTACSMTANYECGAPSGLKCQSVTSVYEKSISGELKEKKAITNDDDSVTFIDAEQSSPSLTPSVGVYPVAIKAGNPLRDGPKVLRIWITPWEDKDKDFHEQSFVHIVVNQGHWLLKENLNHLESEIEGGDFFAN